jgi:hypothetical protein
LIGGPGLAQSVVDVFASGEKSRWSLVVMARTREMLKTGLSAKSRLCF